MRIFAIITLATGLTFHAVGGPAMTNAPPPPTRPALFQRVYQTDTNSFFANLRRRVQAKAEKTDLEVLKDYLKQEGIHESPPFSLYYKPRTGLLLFRATEEDQQRIKLLLAELQSNK